MARTCPVPRIGPASRKPPAPPGRDGARLIIRLASPAVFVDAAGRPSLEPDQVLDLDGARRRAALGPPGHLVGLARRIPRCPSRMRSARSPAPPTGSPARPKFSAISPSGCPGKGRGCAAPKGFGDIRIAGEPWRPPAPAAPRQVPAAADVAVTGWLADLHDLALDPPQLRWVADALRELQLARERQASGRRRRPGRR